jgi:hypothetical protein
MNPFDLYVKWALWVYFGGWAPRPRMRTERVEP